MAEDGRNKRTRYAMAGVGALALTAMGAFGAMVTEAPISSAVIGPIPVATMGKTVTKSTTPSELETSVATPPVKAERPDGYGG
ncbi:hypothetical protein [Mycobacterium sp. GA-1841]|uniref:hypothetical protein n=1 Tax=Mycobacterium sp. GA-1841 TaxID=1834154 RepID=UPI00096D30BC|nr:hypothetical protein [Mycobacterium sp. GA-1841]